VLGSTEKTHGVRMWRLSDGAPVPVEPPHITLRDIDDTLSVIDLVDVTSNGNVVGSVIGLSTTHPLVEVTSMVPAMDDPESFLRISEETFDGLISKLPM